MKVLLEAALAGATVESAVYHDWRTLRNNDLLAEAHRQGFTALVTSDKRLASEQSRLPIARGTWAAFYPPRTADSMSKTTNTGTSRPMAGIPVLVTSQPGTNTQRCANGDRD